MRLAAVSRQSPPDPQVFQDPGEAMVPSKEPAIVPAILSNRR
jgi:hypothetical protein